MPLALRRFIEIVKVTVKDMVPFSCGIASPRPIGRSLLLGLIGLKFCGLNLQPITKAVVAIVNLEPLLKSAWFIIMLALLSEYFAEYKDEPKNL